MVVVSCLSFATCFRLEFVQQRDLQNLELLGDARVWVSDLKMSELRSRFTSLGPFSHLESLD